MAGEAFSKMTIIPNTAKIPEELGEKKKSTGKDFDKLESNITPLDYFKVKVTKPLQQRGAEEKHLLRMGEHLSTGLCKTVIRHAQED